MMYRLALLLAAVCTLVLLATAQTNYYCGPVRLNRTADECPRGWYKFESRCYLFNQYPPLPRDQAQQDCVKNNGMLLRIDSMKQFEFITSWLDAHSYDSSVPMYTSGRLDPANRFSLVWEFHNVNWRTELISLWLDEIPREGDGKPNEFWEGRDTAMLGNNGAKWGWLLRNGSLPYPYICEADSVSLSAALANQRDFEYGVTDITKVTRSPCMIEDPVDKVYILSNRAGTTITSIADFECVAYGNPMPIYRWYRFSGGTKELIQPLTMPRYSITNGKLTINQATSSSDAGQYACEAINEFGSVMSKHASLSFGLLAAFPNTQQETIQAQVYFFTNIECKLPDNSGPRRLLNFQFYFSNSDGSALREVRPDTRGNMFISQSTGTLYFSEVGTIDAAFYRCQVGINTGVSIQEMGPVVKLEVANNNEREIKLRIADGFPASVPSNPMRGDDVRLECVGYGSMIKSKIPLKYHWRRAGGLIPGKASYIDPFYRVLLIPNAQAEDSGKYECRIEDGNRAFSVWQSLELSISSIPFFVTRPFNQFVDAGIGSLSFTCKAGGTPTLAYEWMRGNHIQTEALRDIPGLDRTRFNWTTTSTGMPTLLIQNPVPGDAATYGCRVNNSYGTVYAFAELKILSFAPSFVKNPISMESGLVGKLVYLPCDAEGAPEPTRQWRKGDVQLNVVKASDQPDKKCPATAKLCELLSGRLQINPLTLVDAGEYKCIATNIYGSANNSVILTVGESLKFDFSPENRYVLINSTVDLPCQISPTAANIDVNYAWRFENTDIKFGRYDFDARRYEETQFYRPYKKDFGTLRISNIQYDYEGNYTCVVQTPLGYEEKSAYLRVAGPPGPCAGVKLPPSINSSSFVVTWRHGEQHLSEITAYVIELQMRIEGIWREHMRVRESPDIIDTQGTTDNSKRKVSISGLPFYHHYRLRISAVNEYGVGEPSPPTAYFVTASGPPSKVPANVTGGGGKVQTLMVRWRQIDEAFQGAANFSYEIHYQLASETGEFQKKEQVIGKPLRGVPNHREYAIPLSGPDTYFKKYRVKMRGVTYFGNQIGRGEFSELVQIYSAEDTPKDAPKSISVVAFNSTAVDVTWEEPPNYDGVIGNILGYRIVYWPKLGTCTVENNRDKVMLAQRLTVFGKQTVGQVVGLEPDTFYCFSVQMFNSAGDTPESSWRDATTNKRAPSDFPTNVVVHSTGQFSTIRVTWNGIRQRPGEESVDGYMIRWWITGAPATNYSEVDAGMDNEGIVRKLSTDVRYDLRVYGYSSGGIGTFSSPMIQFMIIPKERCVPGASWEAPDIKYVFVCSACRSAGAVSLALFAVIVAIAAAAFQ